MNQKKNQLIDIKENQILTINEIQTTNEILIIERHLLKLKQKIDKKIIEKIN
jgi:hypothetical protein